MINLIKILSLSVLTIITLAGCQGEKEDEKKATASPRATEKGWPKYEEFGGPFASPGWAGDWADVPKDPIDEESVAKVPLPVCGQTYIITAGDASAVQPANCPGAKPTYQSLCDTGFQRAGDICKRLCARTANAANPCVNWQLQPHIYEERGCLGSSPPTPVVVPWRRYCEVYEGCVCTFEIG